MFQKSVRLSRLLPAGALAGLIGLSAGAGLLTGCLGESQAPEAEAPAHPARPDRTAAPLPEPLQATAEQAAFLEKLLAEQDAATPPPAPPSAPKSLAKAAHHGDCNVNFGDATALSIMPNKAGDTFAVNPWYIHNCHGGYAWAHVREYHERANDRGTGVYNHYHLMYERGNFCLPPGGGYGLMSGGVCQAVANPAAENRDLYTHMGDQWIRLYVYRSGNYSMTFDFKRLTVLGSTPVQLWIKKASGNWLYWPSLAPNGWNVSAHAAGIVDIAVRGASGYSTTFGLDDLLIHVPYQ